MAIIAYLTDMQKIARKPSSDPLQEKLRQDKTTWNKEMSAFINDIIHLKKTMNGWPSKFYKERSRISDPIPADPTTIIGALAGDFQELAQRGNNIVQQQLNYAKNRKKRQPKQLSLPHTQQQQPASQTPQEAPKPEPDLSKQLSLNLAADRFEIKYGLIAEGSSPFSRFVTRTITPIRGVSPKARERRLRMDLLNSAIKTYRGLGRLQVHIVSSHKDSATAAYKEMQRTWNDWKAIPTSLKMYGSSLNNLTNIDVPPEAGEHTDQLEDLPVPPPAPAPVIPAIPPANDNTDKPAEQKLQVAAQAFLKKWLGKARHQWMPKNTSSYRLEVYNLAVKARENINKLMDLLEKSLDIAAISAIIVDVNRQMTSLRLLVRSVHFTEKPGEAHPGAF